MGWPSRGMVVLGGKRRWVARRVVGTVARSEESTVVGGLAVTVVVAVPTASRMAVVGVVVATAVSLSVREVAVVWMVGAVVEAAVLTPVAMVAAVGGATAGAAVCTRTTRMTAVRMTVDCGRREATSTTPTSQSPGARLWAPGARLWAGRGRVGLWRHGRVAAVRRLRQGRLPLGMPEGLLRCLVSMDWPRGRVRPWGPGRVAVVQRLCAPPLSPAVRVSALWIPEELLWSLVSDGRRGTSWTQAACLRHPAGWLRRRT